MIFTKEELEELARADAEIEEEFTQTQEEIAASRERDRKAKLDRVDYRTKKLAEYQKAYYEANREKIAEYQKAYNEANREKIAKYMREYRKRERIKQ